MATLATTTNTLADIVNRTAPDGSIERDIASRVQRKNQLLQYLPWKEGNKADGNQIVRATNLPTVGYQKFNEGRYILWLDGTVRRILVYTRVQSQYIT